jgi:adenosylhomocysteine nucleosidase
MTTGILCATPEELDALHHRFQFDSEPTTLAGFQVWQGHVHDRSRPIVLAQSGIGKVNAATLATILFTTFGCDDLIFSGVAGALTDLEVGSVVLVTRGATHDYGLVSNGVFTCVPVGDLSLPGIAQPLRDLPRVPAQVEQTLEHLRDRMADKLTIRLGSVLSGDAFVNCIQTRARLQDLGGEIVDMESAAVLEVARRFDRGAYIIRTISDGAGDDSHLSYAEMVAMVAHNSALCVEDLLRIMP